MHRSMDMILAYRLVKKLATRPENTDAFRLGLIDKNAKRIKKPKTPSERAAYTSLDKMVFNLQRIIKRVPGGSSKLSSYAAALWLIKEQKIKGDAALHERSDKEVSEGIASQMKFVREIASANAVGGGHIAGVGIGPAGEPGVSRKKKNDPRLGYILRRKLPNG